MTTANTTEHERVGPLSHLRHVLYPPTNWQDLVSRVEGGTLHFPIPGRPDARRGAPWPVEWILARVLTREEEKLLGQGPGDDGKWMGWRTITATCVETGEHLDCNTGVRCARCRDPILKARVFQGFDRAPYCALCRWALRLTGQRPD